MGTWSLFKKILMTKKKKSTMLVLKDTTKTEADKAHRWLKSLPPGSITSWEECKSAFLSHFYTKSRSNSLRNKLGLHPKYQLSLDNLSASSSNTCTNFDRTICSSNSDSKEIADLKNMMNQLLRNQQRGVNSCETINNGNMEPFQEDSYDQEEEVNYVGAQGYYQNRGYNNNFNNNFRNTSNLSYRNPNVENPQDQNYPQQANRFQGNNFGGNNNNNFLPRPQFNIKSRLSNPDQPRRLPLKSMPTSTLRCKNSLLIFKINQERSTEGWTTSIPN
ncbi:PREDICTED: putative uncharacterized protein DDB_G0286901 [Camelina sativa]|uniref:Retrotransposon gag domain-containing protein n=1 Tax=Camelina sativa TaxID=90675 RepID=A0ABM0U6I3_CAMSA|nr:PREDICTED: putative uncharacterized protein DDB_G0286901 [Camelina sativa]